MRCVKLVVFRKRPVRRGVQCSVAESYCTSTNTHWKSRVHSLFGLPTVAEAAHPSTVLAWHLFWLLTS